MIYVSADWHGWPLDSIQKMLRQAGFSGKDYLFVLGDVIDRGDAGVELLRWMAVQPNVQLILGNHEAMLLSCAFLFEQITEESLADLTPEKMYRLRTWCDNGGGPTIQSLNRLIKEEPDVFDGIWEYLQDAPLFEELTCRGRRYVLVHGGLGSFSPDKPLALYTPRELLWERPDLDTSYDPEATVIFGHTPTLFYGEQFKGKPILTPTWTCIDTGAACGLPPMLLRLEDGAQFFADRP